MSRLQDSPLYQPCLAAHSPIRLDKLVAREVANIIIECSIPFEIRSKAKEDIFFTNSMHMYPKLDDLLLGTASDRMGSAIKTSFKSMKAWWEANTLFGGVGTPLQNLVQEAILDCLDNMDYYSHCPLFRFTCQLCYTKEAGIFNQSNAEIIVKVPKRFCDSYANILKDLGTFQIERIFNTYMIFGNPNPLVVVLKNSPRLRSVHFRYNGSNFTMSVVGKYCPQLECFIMEECLGVLYASEEYLFKTFFKERSKEVVIKHLEPIARSFLSFPKLVLLDVGKSDRVKDFLRVVNYFYPNLKSLSCNSSNLTPTFLLSSQVLNVPFSIQDLSLTSHCLITLSETDLLHNFSNIKHVTFIFESISVAELSKLSNNLSSVLSKLGIFSLTVDIPFECPDYKPLEETLCPLFTFIGRQISRLQFSIHERLEKNLLWTLINLCPNLELLGIRMHSCLLHNSHHRVRLSPLPNLRALSFSLNDFEVDEQLLPELTSKVQEIIEMAPMITSLEVQLPEIASTWIMNTVAKGYLKHVTTFIFQLENFTDINLDVDYYVVLLEALSSLKTLILNGVPLVVLVHLKKVFRNSNLSIVHGRRRSWVAYPGLCAKFRANRL